MMTRRDKEILIAAFFDNELSMRKRRLVEDLLRRDRAASEYLASLSRLRGSLTSIDRLALPSGWRPELPESIEPGGMDPASFLILWRRSPDAMLTALIDGELSQSQACEVSERMERESDLQNVLNTLRRTRESVARLPKVAVPENLAIRIHEAVRRSGGSGGERPKAAAISKQDGRWSFGRILTAYLDRELSARRRMMVEKALRRSRRGRLFLKHHAQIKRLLKELSIERLDRETFHRLLEQAVKRSAAPSRIDSVIAEAAETIPSLSHRKPMASELPSHAPEGAFLGFRWTSYIALSAAVVLVLAFAQLAFHRSELLQLTRGPVAASGPRRTVEDEMLVAEAAKSRPLEGRLPDRRARRSDPAVDAKTDHKLVAEPFGPLAALDGRRLSDAIDGKQIRLTCDKADEAYERVYFALRNDEVVLPKKLAIPDLRPERSRLARGAIAVDLALTAEQWSRLFALLRQVESADPRVLRASVDAPSKELVDLIRKPAREAVMPEVAIVPSLVVGPSVFSVPSKDNLTKDDLRARGIGKGSFSRPSEGPNPSDPPRSAGDRSTTNSSAPGLVRVILVFEEES